MIQVIQHLEHKECQNQKYKQILSVNGGDKSGKSLMLR